MQKIRFNLPEFEIENLARAALEAMERSYSDNDSRQNRGINDNVKKQKQNEQKQRLQHA